MTIFIRPPSDSRDANVFVNRHLIERVSIWQTPVEKVGHGIFRVKVYGWAFGVGIGGKLIEFGRVKTKDEARAKQFQIVHTLESE